MNQPPAPLRLSACFGDHMVLQADQPLVIWGWAMPNAQVAAELADLTGRTDADAEGRWRLTLGSLPASSEPRELIVTSGGERRVIHDVLVGEVWLCSGQSNMVVTIGETFEAQTIGPEAELPTVRILDIPRTKCAQPMDDCPGATWQVISPDNARQVSAVAFHFARMMHQKLDVPIGIVLSAWGGSALEPWVSPTTIAQEPAFEPIEQAYREIDDAATLAPAVADWAQRVTAWRAENAKLLPSDEFNEHGADRPMPKPPSGETAWSDVARPFVLAETPEAGQRAVVWYQRRVTLPPDLRGQALTLRLGCVDGEDVALVNGRVIATTDQRCPKFWLRERKYNVPADLTGSSELVVHVRVRYLFAGGNRYGNPEGMSINGPEGQRMPIDGGWQAAIEKQLTPVDMQQATPAPWPIPRVPWDFARPGRIYNGMIHPLVNLPIAGALWYQGESNTSRAAQYHDLLRILIEDWRRLWQRPDLPFGIVQLAGFGQCPDEPEETGSAELRDVQRAVSDEMPGVGLATAVDVGEVDNIHPRNKRPVGERLARWALAEVYGRDDAWRGPTCAGHEATDDGVVVRFDHVGDGLTTTDDEPPRGFALAEADGPFHWAEARITGPQEITLRCDAVAAPVHVRYAWVNYAELNLTDSFGLPARPMRTDDRAFSTAGCVV